MSTTQSATKSFCNICATGTFAKGYSCKCNNSVCIDCEVTMSKCPFCRRTYPSFTKRMFASGVKFETYIACAKEKSLTVGSEANSIFSFLEDTHFASSEEYYEMIEDLCTAETKSLFLLLKERYHRFYVNAMLMDLNDVEVSDEFSDTMDTVMNRIIELDCQEEEDIDIEIQEDINYRYNNIYANMKKDTKNRLKKIRNQPRQKWYKTSKFLNNRRRR